MDLVGGAADVEPVERLDRRLRLALGGAEGREVVVADQGLRRGLHRLGVEGVDDMPDPAALEHRRWATGEDAVEIVAAGGQEAGVEIGRRERGLQHRDMRADEMVERVAQLVASERLIEIEMRDLAEGVDAGIGAAGAVHRDALA